MKKITYYMLMVITLCGMTITSCSDDEWQPGPEQTDGIQAYLYTEATSYTYLPTDEQSFTLHVARQNTTDAATVHLIAEGENFTVPETVAFSAGEGEKEILITFDLAIGTESSVTISIAEEEGYIYGTQTVTINVTRDYTWQSLGTGVYTSQLFGQSWPQPVEKAQEGNIYRLPDCIIEGYPIVFTLSDDGQQLVTWDIQATGYEDETYGMVYFLPTGMTREGNVLSFPMQGLFASEGGYSILYSGFVETLEMPAQ